MSGPDRAARPVIRRSFCVVHDDMAGGPDGLPAKLDDERAAAAPATSRRRIALILDTRRYTLLIPGAGSVVGDAAPQTGMLVLGNDGTGARPQGRRPTPAGGARISSRLTNRYGARDPVNQLRSGRCLPATPTSSVLWRSGRCTGCSPCAERACG